jgi:hypothetical protein
MTCTRHNLRMIVLVLRGRMHTPEHAALLADVRHCPRCARSDRPLPVRSEVRIPRARVELVHKRLHIGR